MLILKPHLILPKGEDFKPFLLWGKGWDRGLFILPVLRNSQFSKSRPHLLGKKTELAS